MPIRDIALALIIVTIWGFNFVVIKWGLHGVPPLLLCALRFLAVVFPAIFLVKRPKVPWQDVALYGVTWAVVQFGFLFSALHVGMPAGLASVVLQCQAFFTLLFAAVWVNERWRPSQLLGLLVATGGLWLIGSAHGQAMSLMGFVLTICGAAGWGLSNVVVRRMTQRVANVDMLGFVVWASLLPMLVFTALSLALEGVGPVMHALTNLDGTSIFSVLYLAYAATVVGYGLWTGLLKRHPANSVAPFSLLVPWVGLLSASLLLDEQLNPQQWAGSLLLMSGLIMNVFGSRVMTWMRAKLNWGVE
ncbi:O-acetylserine/cysteine efflux transporter [Chitinivorax tropicus]|uniref:O-acetylserine/cysteine efflux transporter n=1 Tax=Chitinivorax tropicus TaxID=714531 RepID=A0A840MMZ3_9PROT|nr:EamA family transporter [Chitinivorax tropicus]MBB5018112.1 O-acetylserine/cysteine efflux transporter [Chitinivorax tropicus]